MKSKYQIVIIGSLLNLLIAIWIWTGLEQSTFWNSPFQFPFLFWMFLSLLFTFVRTSLPFGKSSASLADIIDVAAIAIVGPIPIIIANIFVLLLESIRELEERIIKLPFNISMWICTPILSFYIFSVISNNIIDTFSINSIVTIILMYLAYSSYMILGVSSMISLTEHVNLWSVIKKNYLYYQVASLASIPITIVMIYLWFQEGSVGVILLALPLLLVSIGVNIAFERGRLEERARRDSQLAELGKTAASILHEIKRPISRILMTAEYGLSTTGARDDKEKFGQILDWSAQVRDISKSLLLNLSGKLTVEKARVLSIVDSVIEILSAKYPGRILFDRDPNQDLVVFWDSQSIAMVLQNLITNSLEISESALVTITLEQLINRRGLFARDGSVLITISDTGPGLPAVETERLFDPLFTTRPDGSGIGLFIARQIVLAHGGTLNARTLREGGAEFSVQIPVRTALVSA